MTRIIVPIAAGADDAFTQANGTAYPPTSVSFYPTQTTYIQFQRSKNTATDWYIDCALLRFATGDFLPDDAIAISAYLRIRVENYTSVDSRNITADYTNWPSSTSAHSQNAQTGAISHPLNSVTGIGTDYDIPFLNVSGISSTADTAIRLHIDGGQPVGANMLAFAALEHTTSPEAQLIVTYARKMSGNITDIDEDPDGTSDGLKLVPPVP